MNKKISFLLPNGTSLEKPVTEATAKISRKLIKSTKKEGFEVSIAEKNADFYVIISNGISEAVRHRDIVEKSLYFLLTDPSSPPEKMVQSVIPYLFRNKVSKFTYHLPKVFNSFLPLKVKRNLLSSFKKVVLPTRNLEKKLRLNNSETIPIGINTSKFRKTKKGRGVAFFGSGIEEKGFWDFFEAVRDLKIRQPIRCYLRSGLNKKQEQKVKRNINLNGVQKDMVKAYNENSIVVLPFKNRVHSIDVPLTLIEAMACERAVITTDLPNIKEIASDSVSYVAPSSPNQIREKIKYLTNHENLRQKLGRKARKRTLGLYNDHKMCEAFMRSL